MAMMEQATAAELKCGVTWVVLNNGCLGWPQFHQVLLGQPTLGTAFEISPDFVALAASLGCEGICVTDPAQVEPALATALAANAAGEPVLIDFRIAKHVYPPHFVAVHREKHGLTDTP